MSLPFFQQFGWTPVVLAVDAEHVESPADSFLARTVPHDVPIHRVSAYPARWTRKLGLGNIGYRAWFQLNSRGRKLLATEAFDLVYFSTTQYIVTTLGRRWLREFGVPYVIDIQDPWRTDYYERPGSPPPPGGWKYRFARWQARRLEASAWRQAAGFVSVSPLYLKELGARYAWFAAKPADTIPFAASDSDFSLVRGDDSIPVAFAREDGFIYVVSVGAIGPIMLPAIRALVQGLAHLRARDAMDAARLRVVFVGTSYAPAAQAAHSVTPLAVANGVADLVSEQPGRVGYFSAIKTMLAADALFLPGSSDPGYSPSKIGGCILAGKPVLALLPAQSVAAARVEELGFARIVDPATDSAGVEVADFLRQLIRGALAPVEIRSDAGRFHSESSAEACARRQCRVFERALETSR